MPASCYHARMHTASTLRVHLEPEQSGDENMRRDAALLAAAAEDATVVLRLYTWNPPAVSLGHMQRAAEVLDLAACRATGVDVVRRPTGGRAVLHWQELTYAVVASVRDRRFGTTLGSAHAVIGDCLAAALARFGVRVQLSRPEAERSPRRPERPCFLSSGRAEVLVDGRKLVGSAQRRTAAAFLQHGSLLLGPAHEGLADLLLDTRGQPQRAAALRARLRAATTTLATLLGTPPDIDSLAAAFVHGFCTRLDLDAEVQRRPPAPA